jgi:type IV fimbrial biogenesis protein FimT
MTRPPQPAPGFTLLELMITLAVAAILLGLAVPNFSEMIRNNRLTSSANDLLRATQVARSEAVKRQSWVVVCATADSTATPPACSNGAFRDWIVFVDTDGDWVVDAAEPILERHGAVHNLVTVRNDNKGIISYAASGFSTPPPDANTASRNIVFCDQRGNQQIGTNSTARAILISATGRSRVSRSSNDVGAAITATGACPQ